MVWCSCTTLIFRWRESAWGSLVDRRGAGLRGCAVPFFFLGAISVPRCDVSQKG